MSESTTTTTPAQRAIPTHLGLECEGGGSYTDYDGTSASWDCGKPATVELFLDCGWGETRWVPMCSGCAEAEAGPAPEAPTPEALRAEAAQHDQDAADSFERCDTDGFLSQWASGLTGQQKRIQANIVEQGGRAAFPALFTTEGVLVAAVLRDGQYGPYWAILSNDDPKSRFTGEFVSAFPKRASTLARKGYAEGLVMAPARAEIVGGGGRGLAGAASCSARAVRTDGGFSRDAEIVDNGQPERVPGDEPTGTARNPFWANND